MQSIDREQFKDWPAQTVDQRFAQQSLDCHVPYAAATAVVRKLKLGQRASWTQRFVQSKFLDKKKVGSKVITKAKGALITAFLSGWRYSRKRCALQVLGEISLGESTVLSSQEEGIIISTASYIIGIFKHLQCISPAMK